MFGLPSLNLPLKERPPILVCHQAQTVQQDQCILQLVIKDHKLGHQQSQYPGILQSEVIQGFPLWWRTKEAKFVDHILREWGVDFQLVPERCQTLHEKLQSVTHGHFSLQVGNAVGIFALGTNLVENVRDGVAIVTLLPRLGASGSTVIAGKHVIQNAAIQLEGDFSHKAARWFELHDGLVVTIRLRADANYLVNGTAETGEFC